MRFAIPLLISVCAIAADRPRPESVAINPWAPTALRADIRKLAWLAEPFAAGDWQRSFQEPDQDFDAWLRSKPVTVTTESRCIRVLPIGDFTPAQRAILEKTAEHLGLFYGLPVETLPPVSAERIPAEARRTGPLGSRQLLTTHLLERELPPRRGHAAFIIALTAEDLWPGDGWNFVFGMANLQSRVGVWSIHRFGDPAASAEARHLCLRRAIQVAAHESGHIFSMRHCTLHRCGMNGANSLPEADAHPIEFCPQCLAKLAHATRSDPRERYAALNKWYEENGFKAEADHCLNALNSLRRKDQSFTPQP